MGTSVTKLLIAGDYEKFFAMFNETTQQLKVDNSHKSTHSKEFMKWDN